MLQKFRSSVVSYVPKKCNKGASILAQLGPKLKQSTVWIEDYPVELQGAL